ncbi:MAG: hypothetical protein GQ574_11150 [Crocinitomix sp.]|nr:hypothetical protein [Crocinitomix sp.]
MLKTILGVLFILFTFSSYSQSPFEWPDELQIDPNDYTLHKLGVKEIIQYKDFGKSWKFADSTKNHQTLINYVISYDSLQRVTSFKYDFEKHSVYSKHFGDSTKLDSLKRIAIKTNMPIYFTKLNLEWVALNYWEVIFTNNVYGINRMEVLNPHVRLNKGHVIDGLYLKEKIYYNVRTEYKLNEFDELIQVNVYKDDSLVRQKLYEYETFNRHGNEARLLTLASMNGVTYRLKYLFND